MVAYICIQLCDLVVRGEHRPGNHEGFHVLMQERVEHIGEHGAPVSLQVLQSRQPSCRVNGHHVCHHLPYAFIRNLGQRRADVELALAVVEEIAKTEQQLAVGDKLVDDTPEGEDVHGLRGSSVMMSDGAWWWCGDGCGLY